MPRKNKIRVPINYTSREFQSIKNDLLEYAKRYYPNTYKDFNEAAFGSFMIDVVSYTGDILSYYIDYQANEGLIDTAIEYDNLIRLGRQQGFKFRAKPSSTGVQTFYVIVPANLTGLGPDMSYVPKLLNGTSLTSTTGNQFILIEDIDFSDSNNEVVVANVDETTGVPTYYAIKSHGKIISGEIIEEFIEVGTYQEFFKARMAAENVAEILSVTDSEGHDYYEVENLSQNVIYTSIANRGGDKLLAPNLLKPIVVPRRFTTEQDRETTYLQFGFGTPNNLSANVVADPTNVVMRIHGKDYVTDDSFDPTKLIETDKFGIAPANTILQIIARRNTSDNVNAAVNTITRVTEPVFEFDDIVSLNGGKVNEVIDSLETTNESSIVGDVELPSSEELKIRIGGAYASQNRAVTREDYKSVIYNMPERFGAVKRVNIIQDNDSFKRNLNIYVISENANGTLVQTSDTIKQNLKTWLNNYKMINDSIDILDAIIVDVGVEFEIISTSKDNKYAALNNASLKLQELFEIHFDIGEPLIITDIFTALKEVPEIADATKVKIVKKSGANYSSTSFNIDNYISFDGRYINAPENIIFQVKFPAADIKGSVL